MMIPKLRFAEFSGSWIKDKISSFIKDGFIIGHLDGNHGALYPRSEEFSQNGVPYISATDFSSGEVDFNSCKYLPISRANQFKKGIAKSGDVLFAHNATVGPVSLLNTNYDFVILSTTATYFRCDTNKLNNAFLKNSLESEHFVKQYSSIMSQSTRNQVPITAQRDLIISVPNIIEQNKIACFLSAVDEKITLLNKQYNLLCQYKKGMMQKIFNQEVRFRDENGDIFPAWQENILSNLGNAYSGLTGKTAEDFGNAYSGLTGKTAEDFGKGTFYITYKQIFDNRIIQPKDFGLVCISKNEKQNKVKYGDLFFTTSSETPGEVAFCSVFLETEMSDCYLNSFCFGYRLKNIDKNHPVFLSFLFRSEYFRAKVKTLAQGSTRYNISKAQFMMLSVNIPVTKEQTKIANFLSALDDKIAIKKVELDRLKTWRQGLLQQMFV